MNVPNAVSIVSLVLEEQTTVLLMEDVDLVYSSIMILSNVFLSVLMVYMEILAVVSVSFVHLDVYFVLALLCKNVLSVEPILTTLARNITNILSILNVLSHVLLVGMNRILPILVCRVIHLVLLVIVMLLIVQVVEIM